MTLTDTISRLTGICALLDRFPVKELQDYWSTRPHYESNSEGQADVDGVTRTFGEWQVSGSHAGVRSDAPPPYSLEDASAQPGVQAPWAQQLQQQKQVAAVLPSGAGVINRPALPPPVPLGTRPPPSHSSLQTALQAGAIPLAAAAIASTFSTGNTQRRPSLPPPVDMLSRPAAPPRPHPHHAATPPLPSRPLGHGHGHMPEPVGAYQSMSAYSHHAPMHSLGHGDEYARGRTKHRSHSRSSGSHSRSKSRRRRSSSARRKAGSPVHAQHARVHHSQSHGHGHGHEHSLSSPHGMGFPTAGSLHHAHSDSGYGHHAHGHGQGYELVRHGSHTPVHSVPVGFGHLGQAAPYGLNHPGYAVNYPNPGPSPGPSSHQGYDAGFGYAQGQGSQPYQHGYTQCKSSSSSSLRV